jgi:hypothetical protein
MLWGMLKQCLNKILCFLDFINDKQRIRHIIRFVFYKIE